MYYFIKVTGEDGMFFDYVGERWMEDHIALLIKEGYKAEKVKEEDVPPCKFRFFDGSLQKYQECSHLGGDNFYFDVDD